MPPGRRSSTRPSASAISTDAMRLRDDDVERPLAAGRAPLAGPDARAPSPLRCALARVASTAIGSTSTREHSSRAQAHRGDRQDPGARADVEHAGRGRLGAPGAPRSAIDSSAARHSRVVGWSPVPNAMPGSSASTTSPGSRWWRRHVGRITIRRPTRSTGKCAFHAFAQSASQDDARLRGPRSAAARTPGGGRGRARPARPRPGPRADVERAAGARARARAGRGPRARPAPRRPARTPARRSSRRARRATGSRTRPRRPRGRRRSTAPASDPGEAAAASRSRPASGSRRSAAGSPASGASAASPEAQLLAHARRAARRAPRPRPRTARAARAGAW